MVHIRLSIASPDELAQQLRHGRAKGATPRGPCQGHAKGARARAQGDGGLDRVPGLSGSAPMARLSPMSWLHRLVVGLLCAASPAAAADLGSVGDFDVRLDTTLRASLGLRLDRPNPSLLSDANADDGDRAFRRGAISARMDFMSQLDVSRGDLGFTLSVDGWYDIAYQTRDANHSTATFNPVSVSANGFPADVRRLMGATVELANAYVRDKFEIGGIPITVRIGRQTLLWGESLFFPQDGIAAAQSPVDVIKQISQPLVETREVLLPVGQADIHMSLPYGLSLEGYYQFEWRRDRTPGVASYFSTSDVLDVGGQRAFTPRGDALFRGRDNTPSGLGQFGAALRRTGDVVDLGLYAIRYDAKEPQIAAIYPSATTYRAVFPRGIELLGVSASTYLGDDTLSGEISGRWHMPLVSRGLASVPFGGLFGLLALPAVSPPDPSVQAGYATGQTLHALVSYERQLRPGRLWDTAVLDAEFAVTDLLRVETHPETRLAGTTRLATALEVVFTPRYYQVLPGLDLAVQLGVQLGLSGRSSVDPGMVAGTGNVTLSVSANYRTVWDAGVSFTHFIGPSRDQALADRDFITFTVSRTF